MRPALDLHKREYILTTFSFNAAHILLFMVSSWNTDLDGKCGVQLCKQLEVILLSDMCSTDPVTSSPWWGCACYSDSLRCFPKEKQNFVLSKNMQNFLLTKSFLTKKQPNKTKPASSPKINPKQIKQHQTQKLQKLPILYRMKLAHARCRISLWWAHFSSDLSGKKILKNIPATSICFGAITVCVKNTWTNSVSTDGDC